MSRHPSRRHLARRPLSHRIFDAIGVISLGILGGLLLWAFVMQPFLFGGR